MKNHGRLIIVAAFLCFLISSPALASGPPSCAELADILAQNPFLTGVTAPTSTLMFSPVDSHGVPHVD